MNIHKFDSEVPSLQLVCQCGVSVWRCKLATLKLNAKTPPGSPHANFSPEYVFPEQSPFSTLLVSIHSLEVH